MLKRYLKDQRGLTLIELLAVIVILGIIAAIAVPSIGGIIGNTKEKAHRANALMLLDAARLYDIEKNAGNGNFTLSTATPKGTISGNSRNIEEALVSNGYLDAIPKDPEADNAAYSTITITKNGSQISITLGGTPTGGTAKTYVNNKTKDLINTQTDLTTG
ncbi:competence type IV pilus major pilin ComGC [Aneurinibacillus tyrosinisolvens]|uniref:competence type IV pilus major pilin ComGC n=1 Tax=Aneurinibacillus tyrosinisolvens TaxID=1443435 RepID=UPI0009E5AB08|nr:prepilin-type N-terminal cleavage/methylation domain-containing protein [Aneurinibacillus tyrosinisolvens]